MDDRRGFRKLTSSPVSGGQFLRAEDVRKIVENLGAGARDREAATEDAVSAKSAAKFLEEIRQAPRMEAEVPRPPAPQVRYIEKLVSPPGHFRLGL